MRHHMSGSPQATNPQAQAMGGTLLGDMRHHMSGGPAVTDPQAQVMAGSVLGGKPNIPTLPDRYTNDPRAQMLGGQTLDGRNPSLPPFALQLLMNRRFGGFGGM
jgi:hypothetical protein